MGRKSKFSPEQIAHALKQVKHRSQPEATVPQ